MALAGATPPQSGPPRARLAFRVGTVGHRPNRLKKADLALLANLVHEVLAVVKKTVVEFPTQSGHGSLYTDEAPLLRAVSPLAEGTDRLFAEQALSLGYALCCPTPFLKDEYQEDFDPDNALEEHSVERFCKLFDQASQSPEGVTFELEGDRSNCGEAYGEAGHIALNQSDLLVVIWDGEKARGEGGTVQTLHEATNYRVPVLWVDAFAPHPWRLLRSGADLECLKTASRCTPGVNTTPAWDDLRQIVLDTVRPPSGRETTEPVPVLRTSFFRERKPSLTGMFWWKMFRDFVGSGKFRLPTIRVQDFEAAVSQEWPTGAPGVIGRINQRLRAHYAWSDKLADIYADQYRSTYVVAYLLAAVAVFLALLPDATGLESLGKRVCILGELLSLIIILVLVFWSRRRHWHDRWMQYRLLAELIRQLRLLIPLGGRFPLPQLPAHLWTYGDPLASWMFWHMRALARATGIPRAIVNKAYIAQSLSALQRVLNQQIKFHKEASSRSKRIDHRLHIVIFLLLLVTVVCVIIHLFVHSAGEYWLTLACAGFPALGAALAGIINQGEFARIAKRSDAMAGGLSQVSDKVVKLSGTGSSTLSTIKLAQEARTLAERTARLMVDELLDWNVIFLDRPPEVP